MFGNPTYLLWLALFVGVPLLILSRWRRAVWQQRRALGWVLFGALAGGWAWDALSVRWEVWRYESENIAGLWLIGLPIEEWLWIGGVALMFGALTVILVEQESVR